jgi:sigma-B regulation protein RsbU (phosphoserine phosphatase)
VYHFYSGDVETPEKKRNIITRSFRLMKSIFITFVLKLSPDRRLFYGIILFFFIFSVFSASWQYAILSFIMLNILLAIEVAEKVTLTNDIEIARQLQLSLVPLKAPGNIHYDIACFSEPAKEVGGDYYDFMQPDNHNGQTYLFIGDVSGKGLPAALYMMQAQTILRMITPFHSTPKKILTELCHNLKSIFQKEYFLTITAGAIHGDGSIEFCRAGHMPLIHYSQETREYLMLTPKGLAVGISGSEIFEKNLEECRLEPRKGDILIFYTDGITEAMTENRTMFGDEQLRRVITSNAHKTAQEILNEIISAVSSHCGYADQSDDMTLIVMKKNSA